MNFGLICSLALVFVTKGCETLVLDVQDISISRQATDKCDLTAKPQCSSDCSTIMLCLAGIEDPITSVKCNSSTPYCQNGKCVASTDSCSLNSQTSSFLCTSSGVFPDPYNCAKYHYCPDGGFISTTSECPNEEIFDSKSKLCVRRRSNNRRICKKLSCDGVANDFITFAANPAFYAYCFVSTTGVRNTYMYKCDDDVNKVFDLKMKVCRFKCKSVGYFADPMDCSAYYICDPPNPQFASRHVNCPKKYFFNGTACLSSSAHCPVGSIPGMGSTTPMPTTLSSSSTTSSSSTLPSTSSSSTQSSSTPSSSTSSTSTSSTSSTTSSSSTSSTTLSSSTSSTTSSSSTQSSTTPSSSTSSTSTSSTSSTTPSTLPSTSSSSTTSTSTSSTSTPSTSTSSTDSTQSTTEPTNIVTQQITSIVNDSDETIESTVNVLSSMSIENSSKTNMPTMSTLRPGPIWKHMGRFSVRVGRVLNFV